MNRQSLLNRLEAVCGEITMDLDRKLLTRREAELRAAGRYVAILSEACPDGVFLASVKIRPMFGEEAFIPEVIPQNDAAETFLLGLGFDQPYADDAGKAELPDGFDPERGWVAAV